MTTQGPSLEVVWRSLAQRNALSARDRASLLALPFTHRRVSPGNSIFSRDDPPNTAYALLGGFAYQQVGLRNGKLQTVAIHIPGDFIGLENFLRPQPNLIVRMSSPGEIAIISAEDIQRIAMDRPRVGRALWLDTTIAVDRSREWIVSLGIRNGHDRLAHLICELAERLDAAGLGKNGRYEVPMTQVDLGEAIGMTTVHVNRMLKMLRDDNLIQWTRGALTILDSDRLKAACSFRSTLLQGSNT